MTEAQNTPPPVDRSAGIAGALVAGAVNSGLMAKAVAWLGRNSIGAWLAVGLLTLVPAPPGGHAPAAPAIDEQGQIRMTMDAYKAHRAAWIAEGERRAIDRMAGLLGDRVTAAPADGRSWQAVDQEPNP
jgi:hypothetical protein